MGALSFLTFSLNAQIETGQLSTIFGFQTEKIHQINYYILTYRSNLTYSRNKESIVNSGTRKKKYYTTSWISPQNKKYFKPYYNFTVFS